MQIEGKYTGPVARWTEDNVSQWIKSIGVGKIWQSIADILKKNQIDGASLITMEIHHFKHLEIPEIQANTIYQRILELKRILDSKVHSVNTSDKNSIAIIDKIPASIHESIKLLLNSQSSIETNVNLGIESINRACDGLISAVSQRRQYLLLELKKIKEEKLNQINKEILRLKKLAQENMNSHTLSKHCSLSTEGEKPNDDEIKDFQNPGSKVSTEQAPQTIVSEISVTVDTDDMIDAIAHFGRIIKINTLSIVKSIVANQLGTSLEVSWTPIKYGNGINSPITYDLQICGPEAKCQNLKRRTWSNVVNTGETVYRFHELKEDSMYYIRIRGRNYYGPGSYSTNLKVHMRKQFRWDQQKKSELIKLDEDDFVAKRITNSGHQNANLLANVGWETGIHQWTLELNRGESASQKTLHWILVGVATEDIPASWHTHEGKLYTICTNRATWNNGQDLGVIFGKQRAFSGIQPQKLTLTLDCDEHTLAYTVQNEDSVFYKINVPNKKLFPVVHLYNLDNTAKIISGYI